MTEITREQAIDIANKLLQSTPGNRCSIRNASSEDEMWWQPPRLFYDPIDFDRCWVIYLDDPDTRNAIISSSIIAISKDSGEVVYWGSANDEG